MRAFFLRHQPSPSFRHIVLAGLGGLITIAIVGALSSYAGTPLLMAPFGASCVLLYSVHASPLSQPLNVVAGHFVSTAIGLALRQVLPNEWWAVALAVGLAIAMMSALRITHPPAGADPLVVFAADPGWHYLFFPVLSGAVALVLIASLYHRASGTAYPMAKA
jgi:CBS-domain-containing membrane protein